MCSFYFTGAVNLQNMKPVQSCTGFILCTFHTVEHLYTFFKLNTFKRRNSCRCAAWLVILFPLHPYIFHILVLQEYWVLTECRIPLKPVLENENCCTFSWTDSIKPSLLSSWIVGSLYFWRILFVCFFRLFIQINHLPKPLLSYIGTFFTFPACILPGAYRVWFRLTFRLKINIKQSILNSLAIKSQNPVLKWHRKHLTKHMSLSLIFTFVYEDQHF